MQPTAVRKQQRRGCAGCFYGLLLTVVLLLLIFGAGWFFFLRPLAHNIAQSRLDIAMSAAIQQLPSVPAQLPVNTFQIQESTINNLIVLNLSPADPVQHPQTTITSTNVRIDFQLYGFPCAITEVPKVVNGKLIATNVSVEGMVQWIMSADEVTTLSNKHLTEAQNRIQHTIKSVDLKSHEMDLVLS